MASKSHYYVEEPPPLPPPRGSSSDKSSIDEDDYDIANTVLPTHEQSRESHSQTNPNNQSPSKRWSRSFKPLIPKALLKSTSIGGSEAPPPLPVKPKSKSLKLNPQKHPPGLPSFSPKTTHGPLPSPPNQLVLNSHKPPPTPPMTSSPVRYSSVPESDPTTQTDYSEEEYEDVDFNTFDPKEFPPSSDDGTPLIKFVNKYLNQFPMAFEVVLGYFARSEEACISEGEQFIAHFLKRSKVVSIIDENDDQYTIPLNTSFQFASLFDPNENKKEALSGFVFKTAGDIMISRILPKVIRTRKAFRGVSPESCIVANELLFVREVVQREGERRYLKCIQQESGKERQLHEECVGEFSTSPHDVRVYLPELIKHFQLPLTAVMYLGPDNEEDIPSHLVSAVVTVCAPRTEESLIASTISEEEMDAGDIVPEDTDSIVLNDIPLNFDINVNSIPVTPLNAEKMLKQVEFVYENFNPTNVHPYLASSSSSQISLMKSVRKEGNLDGIELIEPKCLRDIRIERQKTESTSADSIAEFTKINARILAVESQHNILNTTVEHLVRQVKQRNTGDTSEMERAIGSLKMQCRDMKQKLDNLQQVVSDLSIYMEGENVRFIIQHTYYHKS